MKIIDALYLLLITLMLAYDYFSFMSNSFDIAQSVFLILFIILIVSSVLVKRRRMEKQYEKVKDPKDKGKDTFNSPANIIWQFIIMIYILFLMVLFTILGGESTVGLSLTNEFFWVVFIISTFDLLNRWRKRHKQEIP